MKENKLAELSMHFSVQIINLVKDLKAKHETVISNQIGRSGTSFVFQGGRGFLVSPGGEWYNRIDKSESSGDAGWTE